MAILPSNPKAFVFYGQLGSLVYEYLFLNETDLQGFEFYAIETLKVLAILLLLLNKSELEII